MVDATWVKVVSQDLTCIVVGCWFGARSPGHINGREGTVPAAQKAVLVRDRVPEGPMIAPSALILYG